MLTIIETLIDNIDLLVDCAIELIIALAEGIIEALPILIEKAPTIIIKLVSAILENLPKLLSAGVQLIEKLWEGAVSVWETILRGIGDVIWTYIINPIKEKVSDFVDVGKNLIEGLWQGIKDKTQWLKDNIFSFAKGITDSIKNFFGIESPSKLFKNEIGKNLVLGLSAGITDNKKTVVDAMNEVNSDLLKEANNVNYYGGLGINKGFRSESVQTINNNSNQTVTLALSEDLEGFAKLLFEPLERIRVQRGYSY